MNTLETFEAESPVEPTTMPRQNGANSHIPHCNCRSCRPGLHRKDFRGRSKILRNGYIDMQERSGPMGWLWWLVRGVIKVACLAAILLIIFLAIASLGMAGEHWTGAVTRDITVPSSTGIGGKTWGHLYQPYPGARTQIRENSSTGVGSTLRGYIEPSGRIVDPNTGQEIGGIEGLFGR